MPQNATAPSRIGEEVNRRRLQLRLEWGELATRAKISPAHLRKFRAVGTGLSDLAEANLEAALEWAPGSLAALRAGERPTPADHALRPLDADRGKTLGELLLDRGLALPEELTAADNIIDDPVAREIIELEEVTEESRNELLQAYAHMRRVMFRAAQSKKKRPRV